ncbi:MAG: hypothetical protein KAW52_03800 [candidate division Zixibacteria bacterium]|nr:hypothetical protein [candidate division Zixibacteria bacterium]
MKGETYASALDIRRTAMKNLEDMKAWDTGHLSRTIIVDPKKPAFMSKIVVTAPYGVYIEYGARPHFPPPEALEDWARRHGFDSTWPICLAISERGLPERPFMSPAFLKIRDLYFKRLTRIFTK